MNSEILKIMARYQLENLTSEGICFDELLELAIDSMIISGPTQLKDILTVFKMHKIITEKENSNGTIKLNINHSLKILQLIIKISP